MPVILSSRHQASFQSLLNPSGTNTWTAPNTNATYTITNGFVLNTNANNESNDNVKYQVEQNGTVYVYTLHSSITRSADNPGTLINETAAHSGMITYAINRDDTGQVSVTIHQVQDVIQDSEGR